MTCTDGLVLTLRTPELFNELKDTHNELLVSIIEPFRVIMPSKLMTKQELLKATQEEILEEAKKYIAIDYLQRELRFLFEMGNEDLTPGEVNTLKEIIDDEALRDRVLVIGYHIAVRVMGTLKEYKLSPVCQVTLMDVTAHQATFLLEIDRK